MTTRHTAVATTLLLALTAVPSTAQTTIHVSGGLNRANVSNGPDWVKRAVAGAAFSFPVSGRLNLQLGADYSQRGFGANVAGAASFSANFDYVEASALLDMALGVGEGRSLHLLAGPTFGLNISCKATFMVLDLPGGGPVDCDDPSVSGDRPNGSDGGVVGGLRAGVGISDSMDLTIGAFYNFGVLNIVRNTRSGGSLKNRTMTARAGFAYRIG